MPDPFRIDAHEVSTLLPEAFLRAINRLLSREARRMTIPAVEVDTTLRDTAADEGVDARVEAGNRSSQWIPKGSSVWQYKRGAAPGPAAIKKEMKKRAVRECIQAGGTYVFVVQADCSDKMVQSRRKAPEEGRQAIQPRRGSAVVLLTASKLAD